MSIDFNKFNVKNISIEYLHLTKVQKKNLINFLSKWGIHIMVLGMTIIILIIYLLKKKIIGI